MTRFNNVIELWRNNGNSLTSFLIFLVDQYLIKVSRKRVYLWYVVFLSSCRLISPIFFQSLRRGKIKRKSLEWERSRAKEISEHVRSYFHIVSGTLRISFPRFEHLFSTFGLDANNYNVIFIREVQFKKVINLLLYFGFDEFPSYFISFRAKKIEHKYDVSSL